MDSNLKIAIPFDGDVLRRRFFNRWKALTLSFPSVQKSASEDISIESYGHFKSESPISEIPWKSQKLWSSSKTRVKIIIFMIFNEFPKSETRIWNRHNFRWWCPQTLILEPTESPDSQFSIGTKIVQNGHHHPTLWRFRVAVSDFFFSTKVWIWQSFDETCSKLYLYAQN